MKPMHSFQSATAAVLLFVTASAALAQPGPGGAPGAPGGAPGGRGGAGGGRGGMMPQLPPEQQALVDQINSSLAAENLAVSLATSNLVAASFTTPKDSAKITEANNALTKAREAWANKAAAAVAKAQASETKLSPEAIQQLIAMSSGRGGGGRGGRGGFGGPGVAGGGRGGRGGPGGDPGAPGGRGGQ